MKIPFHKAAELGLIALCGWSLWSGCAPVSDSGDSNAELDAVVTYFFPDDADPTNAQLLVVDDELLVQHAPGADAEARTAAIAAAGGEIISEVEDLDLTAIRIPAGTQGEVAATLAQSGLFEEFHKNYVFSSTAIPNDSSYSLQPHHPQIRSPEAWDIAKGSSAIVIAVVDSGVESTHPDLSGKIIDGWNTRTNSGDFSDVKGHGTLVAGAAAAISDNGTGVAGVAWDCPVVAVRVSDDSGQATARDLAAGILWAVNRGAKVINVSFAPLWSNKLIQSATEAAFSRGAVVIISAGNGGGTTTATGYEAALFVGAIDSSNKIASFSDRGPFVDLVAPGVGIYSTAIGASYRTADGTSFAAPIVAGAVALARSANPDLRPITIQNLLLSTTVDLGAAGVDSTFAGGGLDAAALVTAAQQTQFLPDVTAPTVRITSPKANGSMSGAAKVSITATDDWGVADVVLSIDGAPFATDTRSPYQFVVDTSTFSPGSHQLSVVATDTAGNVSLPHLVKASFARSTTSLSSATSVMFHSPLNGATVTGDTLIEATLSDSDGLATVEWWVDGAVVSTSSISGASTGVSYLWRASAATSGTHVILIKVLDGLGKQSTANLTLTKR